MGVSPIPLLGTSTALIFSVCASIPRWSLRQTRRLAPPCLRVRRENDPPDRFLTLLTPRAFSPGAEACADCGGCLRRIKEGVTQEREFVPGRFIVNRIVRPRMACTCWQRFGQAPLPWHPIARGRPGPGLLAPVLVSKHADHLPLYRQSRKRRLNPTFLPWS